MRARDISLFVICVAIAAPLVLMTDIFSSGPAGADAESIKSYFAVGVVVGALMAGGASILGFSFKVPAVLSAFFIGYTFCATLLTTLTAQMIPQAEIAATFSLVLVALFAVVGYFAALEIAGGPHGPME